MQSFDKKLTIYPKKNKTKTFSSQATYPAMKPGTVPRKQQLDLVYN